MLDAAATDLDASSLRIGVVVSRYHQDITDALASGAAQVFAEAGGDQSDLHVFDAPGAWELTAICAAAVEMLDTDGSPMFDAVVALGCILTGETTHDQYIAQSVTQGLTAITVNSGVPIAFGVLTCASIEQARARAGLAGDPSHNKGAEAMRAAVATAMRIRSMLESSEVVD
jgi:6,7-dimethyl-8-ribityllumazine synthase